MTIIAPSRAGSSADLTVEAPPLRAPFASQADIHTRSSAMDRTRSMTSQSSPKSCVNMIHGAKTPLPHPKQFLESTMSIDHFKPESTQTQEYSSRHMYPFSTAPSNPVLQRVYYPPSYHDALRPNSRATIASLPSHGVEVSFDGSVRLRRTHTGDDFSAPEQLKRSTKHGAFQDPFQHSYSTTGLGSPFLSSPGLVPGTSAYDHLVDESYLTSNRTSYSRDDKERRQHVSQARQDVIGRFRDEERGRTADKDFRAVSRSEGRVENKRQAKARNESYAKHENDVRSGTASKRMASTIVHTTGIGRPKNAHTPWYDDA